MSIRVDKNKIESIEENPREAVSAIDLKGAYVLPGLINVHTHLSIFFPYNKLEPDESLAGVTMRSYGRAIDALSSGVTTVRCTSEWHRIDILLRSMIERGWVNGEGWSEQNGRRWIQGPRIVASGRGISTTGGHGSGFGAVNADGADEFRRAARQELAAGANHLKIFITGGIAKKSETYSEAQMSREEIETVASVARSKGSYVCAHAGGSEQIEQAARAGVTCFEHCYELDEGSAKAIREVNGFVVPTLSVTHSPAWMKEHSFEPWTIEKAVQSGEDHMKSIRNAVRAGTNIAMGTDIPPGDMNDGVNASVREMELMTQIGMSNLDVVRASTIMPAKLCRIDNLVGQLSEGMLADLIAIPRNPLEDIRNLRQIPFVIKHGKIIRNDIQ
ncbi:MAG: amidohydrolase family protein [Nitrososphaerota archaeon]|nr:amidohydrolase family protein [Nitrososphaerota archaeon]